MFLLRLLACATSPEEAPPTPLTVLAASSLTDILPRVGDAFTAETGVPVTFTFDASSRLAKQLEAGAAADLFLSADAQWIDWAAERSLVRAGSRRDLLGNTLVLVVPTGSSFVPADAAALGDAALVHLALAGENVPAGRYARESLRALGAWDSVSTRVVDGDSVRTALGWVARREAEAAVVYATDARVEPGVTVAFTFPASSHTPIVYPGVVTSSSANPEAAVAFLAFCAGAARPTFEAAGFTVLP